MFLLKCELLILSSFSNTCLPLLHMTQCLAISLNDICNIYVQQRTPKQFYAMLGSIVRAR